MAHYSTRARRQIIEFLNTDPDRGYTAEELASALQRRYGEQAPGKSSVYRLLSQLAEEELLHRYEEEGSKRSCYRIAGSHCHEHLHLKCLDCGKLMHMEEEQSAALLSEILKQSGFEVDEYRSVLFGRCGCKENRK